MTLNTYAGMPYPIEQHARGYFHTQYGVDQIKSDMLVLLQTNEGERVMLPEYGAGLRKFLFEMNDAAISLEIREHIARQLAKFEKRVSIEQIDIITDPQRSDLDLTDDLTQSGHVLIVRILFADFNNFQELQELILPVNIGA